METISDLRLIKTGDTLLVSGHSWLAGKIQDIQKCKWNHAGMFYWCYDELMVIEADKPGVVPTSFSEYIQGKSHLLTLKPKFACDGSEYGKFMVPMLGKKRYGKLNLVFAQPVKFFTNGRIWLGSNKDNPKRFICGQFVEYVYNHFNPDLFPNWKRDAPVDLYNSTHFNQYEFIR